MLNKIFTKILLGVFTLFLFSGTVFAANSTSVRLQQPKSPTNEDTFDITFVALDTNSGQPVSAQCYKKGPTDAGFLPFGSTINLTNGGNTDICHVEGSLMNQGDGTYSFEVVASGSTNSPSNIVNVDFANSEHPGDPINYSKTKPDNCTYKISFKTANDSGKTIKVVLYRSSDTTFNVDSGHQVNSINIGSDTEGNMTDNISPNCDTNYYYAIRAFDSHGNGSGVVGDSNITTTIINPTTTEVQGAIPVGEQAEATVLGGEEGTGAQAGEEAPGEAETTEVAPSGEVLKAETAPNWILTHKTISFLIVLLLGFISYYIYHRKNNKIE